MSESLNGEELKKKIFESFGVTESIKSGSWDDKAALEILKNLWETQEELRQFKRKIEGIDLRISSSIMRILRVTDFPK